MTPTIRRYEDRDHDAVYDICVRTADAGGDARGQYRSDLADRYPVPPDPPVTPDEQMLALHYYPERLLWAGLPEYPAHLHIDLLTASASPGWRSTTPARSSTWAVPGDRDRLLREVVT